MKIDLIHNKIVRETITEGFEQAIRDGLAPILAERYGESLTAIQMHEDYLSCGFAIDSVQYYPLTLVADGVPAVQWISWQVNKSDFKDGVPFAYVGEQPLTVGAVEAADVPAGFAERLVGRAIFCEDGLINIRVEAAALAPTFLSGKYSQTFVDEMARQLTPAICKAMSVRGIENSSIELSLVFAPETYMEHTSENVTYRRLIMSDKTSAPRDFWIMWTRLDGATAYTVSDNVSADTIRFELGEDVPQKIREKEYRFLLRAGKDKYHNAMGRRNITEWREMVKRAIRRGEIEKLDEAVQLSEQAFDVSERFAKMLGVPMVPVAEEPVQSCPDDGMLRLARELLGLGVDQTATEEPDNSEPPFDVPEATASEPEDEPPFDVPTAEPTTVDTVDATVTFADGTEEDGAEEIDDLEREVRDIIKGAEELLASCAAENDEELLFGEENIFVDEDAIDDDLSEDIDPTAELYDEDDEQMLAELRSLDPDEESGLLEDDDFDDAAKSEDTVADEPVEVNAEDALARMRAEMEAQIRLEYEREARMRAEAEMERLKLEQERLRAENERLLAEAQRRKAELEAREEERRAELEARARFEERERERLAAAAKLAVEEQRRIEEERARAESERIAEEQRAAEERARAEEARRLEESRIAERERILRESSTSAEAPVESVAEAPAVAEEAVDNYHYTTKNVRLIFRKHVDPNVTARMHEIIKATVEYYGKEKVSLRIRATIPDDTTVRLEFLRIPEEEMELLANIIKVLGNSGLGIAKAVVD